MQIPSCCILKSSFQLDADPAHESGGYAATQMLTNNTSYCAQCWGILVSPFGMRQSIRMMRILSRLTCLRPYSFSFMPSPRIRHRVGLIHLHNVKIYRRCSRRKWQQQDNCSHLHRLKNIDEVMSATSSDTTLESIRLPYKKDDFGNDMFARVTWST